MRDRLYLTIDQLRVFSGLRSRPADGALAGFRRAEQLRTVALMLADTVAFWVVFLGALLAADSGSYSIADRPAAWVAVPIFVGVLAGFYDCGQYTRKAALAGEYGFLVRYSVYAFLLHLTLNFTVFDDPRRNLLLLTWIGLPAAGVMMRRLAGALLARANLWTLRAVLVGTAPAIDAARALIGARPMMGLQLVGQADYAAFAEGTILGWGANLARHDANLVVVAAQGEAADQTLLKALARAHVPAMQIIALDGTQNSAGERRAERRAVSIGSVAKTSMDFVAAVLMCLVAAPVLVGLAILVKLDGGPVLFRHERVGYRGRAFSCLKFRTMMVSSDAILEELLASDPAARQEWEATRKLRLDPRVTLVGKFLRATSLDELPQLLNVLRGEMSLVGPRPIVSAELPHYGASAMYYLSVVPGVTGLWQVSGRSNTSYAQRVQLDVDYVRNWTFWQDVAILFRTVPAVLLKRGAV
jgi:UDP-galactose-lipid carrier transferase